VESIFNFTGVYVSKWLDTVPTCWLFPWHLNCGKSISCSLCSYRCMVRGWGLV